MKTIKFIMLLFISLLTASILTGCTHNFTYDLDTLKNEVISAEIVEVISDEGPIINTIYIIEESELNDMLTDLSKMTFVVTDGRPQRAKGVCVKLNYVNEYEIICDNIIIKYNSENEHISHKDIYKPEGFDEFISKYKIE